MYAPNLIRVFCNRGLVLSRPLASSSQCLTSNNFLRVINSLHRYDFGLKNITLTNVLFSTSSSPDDNHNVSKEKVQKKRRRIISNSSSDDSEGLIPNKVAVDVKYVFCVIFIMSSIKQPTIKGHHLQNVNQQMML